ncbi:MAG: YbeD family protein [Pseudomonadota bacterium]
MSDQETLLEFPCHFPVKAMGLADDEFEARVIGLVRKHAPDLSEGAVKTRDSKGGKYLSVTITVRATSREQLDNIYRELTACEEVLMAL